MALIEVKNASKIYGYGSATTVALDNVTMNIEKGDFLAIMGPSGSGKSTLMHLIGILDHPTHGDVVIDGKDVAELSEKKRARYRRNKIGFVFQQFNLLPRFNAIDNVALPLIYKRTGHVKKLKRAAQMLKVVGLEDRQYYRVNQLSGGQVQRVAIARALINRPAIILADEPTGNLDSESGKAVMELLAKLHKEGNTIVIVTHDERVASYAKRIVTVKDGRLETDSKGKDAPKEVEEEKPKTKKKATKKKTTKKKAKRSTKKSEKKKKEAKK